MTGPIIQLAAQEHINDLIREAQRGRPVTEVRARRRVRLSLPRLIARWKHRAVTV